MKPNKAVKTNEFYAPTASLLDEKGNPIPWEFKHITSKQNEQMREGCTVDVQITGKPNMYRPKLNTSKYLTQMIVASTVCPDLWKPQSGRKYPHSSLLIHPLPWMRTSTPNPL
jgi:hypothetical protein